MSLSEMDNKMNASMRGSDVIDADTGVSVSMNFAAAGNIDELKALYVAGARFNNQDNDGWTPLFYAVANNQVMCVRYLLSVGVDINKRAKDGWTALMVSLDHKHSEIVRLLLEAGADTNAFGRISETSVCAFTIASNTPSLVRLLLEYDANPNLPHPVNGAPPAFFWSINNGTAEGIFALKEYGADFNIQDKIAGQTSIMVNVVNADLVRALLKGGADPFIKDKDGESAFDYARNPGADPSALEVLSSFRVAENKCDLVGSARRQRLSKNVGDRYDAISRYFKDHRLGDNPIELSALSVLPPVDRCLIIERIMQNGECNILVCIEKLSMAYYKAGWSDFAMEFLLKCNAANLTRGQGQDFIDKLKDLPVVNISHNYKESLQKLYTYYSTTSFWSSEFVKLLKDLCEAYEGNEILNGNETNEQISEFIAERREFLDDMVSYVNKTYRVVPELGSGLEVAYTLANTQVIAFCYLLGGARISHFKFMTSDTLKSMDEESRGIWNETKEEVLRHMSPWNMASFMTRQDAGERMYLVSVEFPCYYGRMYKYRHSGQLIYINDVVDLMYEVMDVKPRTKSGIRNNGEKFVRFSWMFLQDDVDKMMRIFPEVKYAYGNWIQIKEVATAMNRILYTIARNALHAYPFMKCELQGSKRNQ